MGMLIFMLSIVAVSVSLAWCLEHIYNHVLNRYNQHKKQKWIYSHYK